MRSRSETSSETVFGKAVNLTDMSREITADHISSLNQDLLMYEHLALNLINHIITNELVYPFQKSEGESEEEYQEKINDLNVKVKNHAEDALIKALHAEDAITFQHHMRDFYNLYNQLKNVYVTAYPIDSEEYRLFQADYQRWRFLLKINKFIKKLSYPLSEGALKQFELLSNGMGLTKEYGALKNKFTELLEITTQYANDSDSDSEENRRSIFNQKKKKLLDQEIFDFLNREDSDNQLFLNQLAFSTIDNSLNAFITIRTAYLKEESKHKIYLDFVWILVSIVDSIVELAITFGFFFFPFASLVAFAMIALSAWYTPVDFVKSLRDMHTGFFYKLFLNRQFDQTRHSDLMGTLAEWGIPTDELLLAAQEKSNGLSQQDKLMLIFFIVSTLVSFASSITGVLPLFIAISVLASLIFTVITALSLTFTVVGWVFFISDAYKTREGLNQLQQDILKKEEDLSTVIEEHSLVTNNEEFVKICLSDFHRDSLDSISNSKEDSVLYSDNSSPSFSFHLSHRSSMQLSDNPLHHQASSSYFSSIYKNSGSKTSKINCNDSDEDREGEGRKDKLATEVVCH